MSKRQLLKTIIKCQNECFNKKNIREICDLLLSELLKLSNSRYGYICENRYKNGEIDHLHCNAVTDLSWDNCTRAFYKEGVPHGWDFPIDKNRPTLFGIVAISGKSLISNDIQNDSRTVGNPNSCVGPIGMKNYMCIPLYFKKKLIGQVAVGNKGDLVYTKKDIDYLLPYVNACSYIISAFNYQTQQRLCIKMLKMIGKLQNLYMVNPTKSELISRLCHDLKNLTQSKFCIITEPDGIHSKELTQQSDLEVFKNWINVNVKDKDFFISNNLLLDNRVTEPFLSFVKTYQISTFASLSVDIDGVPIKGTVTLANRKLPFDINILDVLEPFIKNCWNYVYCIELQNNVEQEKNKRIKALEEVSVAKDAFLANMSHEIRTPLNGIIGMTEILETSSLTNNQQEQMRIIKQCGLQLLELVNDILDYSKMVSKKMELHCESFDIRKCIESCHNTIQAVCKEKGLEINSYIDFNVPYYLIGDEKRFGQILVNLLGNSAKFTNKGHIFTKVKYDSDSLLISVSDTGIGIPENKRTSIFNTFEQIDNQYNRTHTGTGLGLPICKQLVKLMGGKIWLESKINCGTTFYFTAKLEVDEKRKYSEEKLLQRRKELLQQKKVLIVDDNATNRMIMTNIMLQSGLKPFSVSSADEAMLYIESDIITFDLICLDICMPKTDGIELAKCIKQLKPELPLIALSSFGDLINFSEFIVVLVKPVKQDELIDVMVQIFSESTNIQSNNLNKKINVLIAEDVYTNQLLISKQLTILNIPKFTIVGNGQEAVNAVKREEYDIILMDIKMPKMDGYEATKLINKYYDEIDKPRPYIVAMTANVLEKDQQECIRCGMNSFIGKPISIDDLKQLFLSLFKI